MTATMLDLDTGRALEAKLDALAADVAALTAATREQAERRRGFEELFDDVAPLGIDVFAALVARLAQLEQRGYFEFARSGAGVLDEVVTSFTEADVRQLGENIVLILDTIKEMTQPEVMLMLRRTVHTVRAEGDGDVSMFKLMRQFRDPAVKRGLARLLAMLRSMGAEPAALIEREETP
jgi:uncharacterized protein YjgD (DUF1641 family)